MRDYTRKAKIKDSNEWVIGYHVYVDYLDKHYIFVSEKTHDGFSGMLAMKQYEVDGDTICEPTGLTDKNGNKIWENDVVEIPGEGDCFKVMWSDTEARYEMQSDSLVVDFDNYWSYEVEVIGNTFDNACIDELLKGEEG